MVRFIIACCGQCIYSRVQIARIKRGHRARGKKGFGPDRAQRDAVTRGALDLTSVEDVKPAAQTVAKVVETAPETPAPAGNDGTWQTVVLPSLIPAAEPEDVEDDVELASLNVVSAAVETSTPVYEIRTVTGNRVNVRGGPGTTFGVVGKLVRGDEVEILDDIGTGWVRFRAVDSDTQGWLADFLLTDN